MKAKPDKAEIDAWVKWLSHYGAGEFYQAFARIAQDAESTCIHCGKKIYLDIREGGGIPDWRTADGDYGCPVGPLANPDRNDDHRPAKLND